MTTVHLKYHLGLSKVIQYSNCLLIQVINICVAIVTGTLLDQYVVLHEREKPMMDKSLHAWSSQFLADAYGNFNCYVHRNLANKCGEQSLTYWRLNIMDLQAVD